VHPERRFALGLRSQLLLALVLVTLVAILSVGAITTWQTRQALAADRYERVVALAQTAGQIGDALLGEKRPLAAHRASLEALVPLLRGAVGAEEAVVLDRHGALLAPPPAGALGSDAIGVSAALAGVPPHAERLEAPDEAPLRVVLYVALGRGEAVLRLVFAIDDSVEATLDRAQTAILLLSVIDGLILLFAAGFILRTTVVRPVRELERAARRVAEGDLAAQVTLRGPGELGRLASAFDRMTHSLRTGRESLIRSEKLASVGRLAAGVAHEVGNPLAAILGYVDMLLGDAPEKPIEPALRKDMLERVKSETQRIHHIVQELLAYSRPPRDEPPVPVDVAAVIDLALSLSRASLRSRALEVHVDLPANLPPMIASVSRMTQVCLNLILNAADATGGGGRLTIDARCQDGRVILGFSDDGPGVPREDRDRIFDPFFTTKDPGRGTGLGLSICLSIAEGYGGTVRLCDVEKGARFEVELAAKPSATSSPTG
jgi:signal transduction histidine kinase